MTKLIIPTRRKLITGGAALIACPAVLRRAVAQSVFPGAQLGNPRVKPTAVPAGINSASPLMTTTPLYYGFDTGTSSHVVDATGNTTMTQVNLPGNITSPWGTSLNWTNAVDGGTGGAAVQCYTEATTAIHTATGLMALGIGAAWSAWITFVASNNGDPLGSTIGGRNAHDSEESLPTANANWCFFFEPPNQIYASLCNNCDFAQIGSTANVSIGELHTAILTAVNTASGIATATFWLDGINLGSVAGLQVMDTGSSYSGCQQDPDSQIQFGTIYHVLAPANFNTFGGQVTSVGFTTQLWGSTEAALLSQAPYSGLSF